ncbi:hypothetical protein CYY_008717 [Polysphondylium violaceum]|uniref:EGF-like domain-containing protein n=1 Tax=Polysphondylium violaceum TaxID=133409 RepID=A0A8J4PN15_9MYCE|nr:hypothetical protein CYY_008717 [Polysphondylium violaceum]
MFKSIFTAIVLLLFLQQNLYFENVQAYQSIDLSHEGYKDMYAVSYELMWTCMTIRMFLFSDPTGIQKFLLLGSWEKSFQLVASNQTSALYRMSLIVPEGATVFQMEITLGNGSVIVENVNIICERTPQMDIEIINPTLQYYPSLVEGHPHFFFKVKNYNKIISPPVRVEDPLSNYKVRVNAVHANIYIAELSFNTVTISNYKSNSDFSFKNSDGFGSKWINFNSFLQGYQNTEIYSDLNLYLTDGDGNFDSPELLVFSDLEMQENIYPFIMYSYNSSVISPVLVLGNFTNPMFYSKIIVQPREYPTSLTNFYSWTFQTNSPNIIYKPFAYTGFTSNPKVENPFFGLFLNNLFCLQYTTNATYRSDLVTFKSNTWIYLPYPFGYSKGNSNGYFKIIEIFSDYRYLPLMVEIDNQIPLTMDYILNNGLIEFDGAGPNVEIESIESYQLPNSPWLVLRMRITDDLSGFSKTEFGNYQDIIQGTINDGVYEFLVLQSNPITQISKGDLIFKDSIGNSRQYNFMKYIYTSTNLDKFPLKSLNFSNILSIRFEKNDINVSNQFVNNNMLIYTSNVDKTIYPGILVFKYGMGFDRESFTPYSGSWNNTCNCYVIPFTVPMNYPTGHFEFQMSFDSFTNWDCLSQYLITYFGPDAGLRVYSENIDLIGPMVNQVDKTSAAVLVPSGVDTKISWNISLMDQFNGFKTGLVSVVSSLDLVRYNFTITPDKVVIQGKNIIFNMEITVNGKCSSQSFYIQYLYLEDNAGYFSEYLEGGTYSETQSINPFLLNIQNITKYTEIQVVCENSIIDTTEPTLVTFQFSPSLLDVTYTAEYFNTSRVVNFQFTTQDDNGILLASKPRIYLQDKRYNFIYQDARLTVSSLTTAQYDCQFKIPFGFGFGGSIMVSVFGIVDNKSNFNGYSSSQLQARGLPYEIGVVQQFNNTPAILSTRPVKGSSQDITIIGRNFDSSDRLFINFNNGSIINYSTCIFNTSSIIIFNSIGHIFVPNITITIQKASRSISNSLFIRISDPFVPKSDSSNSIDSSSSNSIDSTSSSAPTTNKPYSCIDNCGGTEQGVCTTNGCICKSPWVGISCSSKVIIIDPVVNTTSPSTNITVPNNDRDTAIYYAIISVVGLNELDRDGNVVTTHSLTKWIASTLVSKYFSATNSSHFYSSSLLQNNVTTNVNVSIDYFNQPLPVNITFANQIFEMNPYSLKYSINISEYSFSSSFNSLQLVLLASIESNLQDECSSKIFQDTVESGSEYVKMQVNDHSLYGRFIKRGIIDGRIKTIDNVLLDSQYNSVTSESKSQSYIGINIPYFRKSVEIDPDFSVLVDNRPASSESENAICAPHDKSKLTKAQLAGIIVGCVAFASIIIASVTYAIIKTKKQKQFKKNIQQKLKVLN